MNEPAVAPTPNHTPAGRFAPGNQAARGHGGSRMRARFEQVFAAACTPDDLADVIRSMVDCARKGDAVAARLLLERAMGKPREAMPEPVPIDLPELRTIADVATAMRVVLAALRAGDIAASEARELSDTLSRAVDLLLAADIEERVRKIQESER